MCGARCDCASSRWGMVEGISWHRHTTLRTTCRSRTCWPSSRPGTSWAAIRCSGSETMMLEALRREVIETANLLPKYGLVWMAGGTVCARDPETGYVVVTPSGMPYETLSPEDMIVTDIDMK